MDLFVCTGNWIVALGKTLIHSIWIALLILSILRLILNSIPDRYSDLRYRISMLSMLLLLGTVGTLFFLLFSPENPVQLTTETEGSSFLLSFKDQIPVQLVPDFHLLFMICTYMYFAGIPVVLIRSALSLRYLRVMRKSGFPVQETWHSRLEQLKDTLGINRNVALMETESLTVPALIGFLKPVILVPAGMFSNLSVLQVETILMHELFHLRRFDTLANVMQLIMENLFFYNPAVWAISKIIRNEREKCCDDRVLNSCADPLAYAKALYELAGQGHQFAHLAPGAGGTDPFQLYTRIKRILNQNPMKNSTREKLFSLLILAGAVFIMLTVTGFSSGFSIVKDNESWQKISISESLTFNPLSTAVFDTIPEVENEPDEQETTDWEELKKEFEEARIEIMEEIDWEELKKEMEEARIDLDSLKMNMDFDFDMDIDIDKIKEEVSRSLEDINWEEIEAEMGRAKVHLDSVFRDLDLDFDLDEDL
ncbi:MAG: M56 family metallopeptidase [Bacteroidota bacterium]